MRDWQRKLSKTEKMGVIERKGVLVLWKGKRERGG
jgi:hypothetical protein